MRKDYLVFNISLRVVLIHLVATYFLVLASRELFWFHDIKILQYSYEFGVEKALEKLLEQEGDLPSRVAFIYIWKGVFFMISLLISLIVSIIINLKNKRSWVNSLIVIIIAYLLSRYELFAGGFIDSIFFKLGEIVVSFGVEYRIAFNGIVYTTLSFVIFLNRRLRSFTFK